VNDAMQKLKLIESIDATGVTAAIDFID